MRILKLFCAMLVMTLLLCTIPLRAESPASTQPTTKPAATTKPAEVFPAFQSILNSMPDKLKLPPKGWDKYEGDEVREWFNKNVIGKQIEVSFELTARSSHKDGKGWVIPITVSAQDYNFGNPKMNRYVDYNFYAICKIPVDLEAAKNADKRKLQPYYFKKAMTIRAVNWGCQNNNKGFSDYTFRVDLIGDIQEEIDKWTREKL